MQDTAQHFADQIIFTELKGLANHLKLPAINTLASRRLLFMTAAHESRFEYRTQIGGGPALGFYQIEPDTYHDLVKNFFEFRPILAKYHDLMLGDFCPIYSLENRDIFATFIARLQYWRRPEPLPSATDIGGLAEYAKRYWNTEKGKAKTMDYFNAYFDFEGDILVL